MKEIDIKCQLCKRHETIDGLTSENHILAKNEYLMRRGENSAHLQYSVCKAGYNETSDKWYKNTHTNMEMLTVVWNQGVDCRTGLLHLGPCIRALCAPYWNRFLPSSPEALRTYRRERPLLAREGN
jgi:hypothetical protein